MWKPSVEILSKYKQTTVYQSAFLVVFTSCQICEGKMRNGIKFLEISECLAGKKCNITGTAFTISPDSLYMKNKSWNY